jgi:DnaA family protein
LALHSSWASYVYQNRRWKGNTRTFPSRCAQLHATAAPAALGFGLADLASRFGAAEVHRLQPLPESGQADALRRRARHRGLELPEETLTYLTRRAPRDFAALCRLLDELDTEALAAQRRLTVPFVRDWLARTES